MIKVTLEGDDLPHAFRRNTLRYCGKAGYTEILFPETRLMERITIFEKRSEPTLFLRIDSYQLNEQHKDFRFKFDPPEARQANQVTL